MCISIYISLSLYIYIYTQIHYPLEARRDGPDIDNEHVENHANANNSNNSTISVID